MSPVVKNYLKIVLTILVLGLGAYFRVDLNQFLPSSEPVAPPAVAAPVSPDAGV